MAITEELGVIYGDLINEAMSDIPSNMTITMHLCRGNYKSTFMGAGSYDAVQEILFNKINVHGYFMEYDDERSGGFEPLRMLPKGKVVVLGVVTTKNGKLESKQSQAPIDQAAKYVEQRAGLRHALLRPWKTRQVSPDLRALCAQIAQDLPRSPGDRTWVLRAFSLISRLRAEVGALGHVESPELLERPSVILDEVLHGVLTWPTIAGITDSELGLPALQALATERGLPFSTVASAIWEAWDDAHRPAKGAEFLAPDSAVSTWFWPHIPSELLEVLLCDARATDIPYRLEAPHWQAFLSALDTAPARAEDARAFVLAPDRVLEEALHRGIESRALFACVWRRMPERAASVASCPRRAGKR